MCYWEEFKKQASKSYLQASEEYAFANEYDSEEDVRKIAIILNERERVLEKICMVDSRETMENLTDTIVDNEKNAIRKIIGSKSLEQ